MPRVGGWRSTKEAVMQDIEQFLLVRVPVYYIAGYVAWLFILLKAGLL